MKKLILVLVLFLCFSTVVFGLDVLGDIGGWKGINPNLAGQIKKLPFPAQSNPETISIQGRVTDKSGNPVIGSNALVFSLYDENTNKVHEETITCDLGNNGVFSVVLGKQNKFSDSKVFFKKQYFLETAVVNNGVKSVVGTMQPLESTPYAITAKRVFGDSVIVAGETLPGVLSVATSSPLGAALFTNDKGPGLISISNNDEAGVFTNSIAAGNDITKAFKVDWFNVTISKSNFGSNDKIPKGRIPIAFTILGRDMTSPPSPTWVWNDSEIIKSEYIDTATGGLFTIHVANTGDYDYTVMMIYQ